jgi:hypothetical protein
MPSKSYLPPAAALVGGICFFLPWAQFSCMGKTWRISGANLGGALWLVPLIAAFMVAAFVYFYKVKRPEKSRLVFLIGAAAALLIIAYKIIRLVTGPKPLYGLIKPEHVGFRILPGGIGTMLGFLAALVGTKFLKPPPTG